MKNAIVLIGLIIFLGSCEKDEDTPAPANAGTNTNNTSNNGDTTNTITLNNSYIFSDDSLECTPFTTPRINPNGILNIISNPCRNSGSKLDGYFKWNYRPVPGTYKIIGTIGSIPNNIAMSEDEFSIVFYGHGSSALYSIGGMVELSRNKTDTSKLDLNWKDVEMAFGHDSSVVKFSGNLQSL